jgi:hypothetical protein
MRLIDADSIHYTRLLSQQGLDMELVPKAVIDNMPTIDAVEVVRCKDCKHRGIVTECPMCYTEDSYDDDYGYDYWDVDKTDDDGFCHCGEMDAEVQDD